LPLAGMARIVHLVRIGVVALVVVSALVGTTVALAAGPMTLLLARSNGRGSVTVSASTTHLRDRIWIDRIGGVGLARGWASVSCESTRGGMVSGADSLFKFRLKPSGRQVIWRYGGGACEVSVLLAGAGPLSVALRGS
jgi:hypothetical protein